MQVQMTKSDHSLTPRSVLCTYKSQLVKSGLTHLSTGRSMGTKTWLVVTILGFASITRASLPTPELRLLFYNYLDLPQFSLIYLD